MKTMAAWIKKSQNPQHEQIHINTTGVIFPFGDQFPEYIKTIHVDLDNFDMYISVAFFPEELLKKMSDTDFRSFATPETVYVELNAVRNACEKWWTSGSVKQLNAIETRLIEDTKFKDTFRRVRSRI